jgi:hypothetical protein
VHTCDEITAPHDLHRCSRQPHLVARVARKEDFVSGLDAARVGADGRHDARAAVRLGRRREDQPERRLRLLVRGLDDDEVVERLERQVDAA